MSEKINCLVCGGNSFKNLFKCTDSLVSGEEFAIAACENCGFTITVSPPDENKIGHYYLSENYISHSDLKQTLTDRLYHVSRNFMLRKKWRLISSFTGKKNGRLLDIGSGTGYFPAYMQKKGWSANGVEISDLAREYSISKFGLEVYTPDEVEALKGNSYDCITLWHVMEHFQDPVYWLGKISHMLKDDGLCLIALPNACSTDAKWFRQFWAAYDVPRHLWHFSPSTIEVLTERNGFSLAKIKGMPLDVFYISVLSYRNQKKHFSLVRGLITGSVITIFNVFKKKRTSSLIYVLRKSTS